MTIADIISSIYKKTKTNSSSYEAGDMLIDINNAYEHVVSVIMGADSKWQWDDSNNIDLPIATASIVLGQQDYSLSLSHLTIDRVELLPLGGATKDWKRLRQIDQQSKKRFENTAMTAYKSTPGLPDEYDIIGTSVFLYCLPNYSQAASLKVYFTRGPFLFTSADLLAGSKSPGFASLFHDLIPMWVAYNYAIENGLDTANGFLAAIELKEQQLNDFYGTRNRDFRARISPSRDSNK